MQGGKGMQPSSLLETTVNFCLKTIDLPPNCLLLTTTLLTTMQQKVSLSFPVHILQ